MILLADNECPDQTVRMQSLHASGNTCAPCLYFRYTRTNIINPFSPAVQFWLCWGLTTRQPLRVILCRLPEKGRKEIEERVEEMKERDREERGTGMKVKKQKN